MKMRRGGRRDRQHILDDAVNGRRQDPMVNVSLRV